MLRLVIENDIMQMKVTSELKIYFLIFESNISFCEHLIAN